MDDEEEVISPIRRALRSLFPVYLTAFLLLIGVGIAVTFFGDPRAGLPVYTQNVSIAHVEAKKPPPQAEKAADTSPIDNGMSEQTDLGPLPKIGADGTTPMKAYGGADPGAGAKIVIVINGMGISTKTTEAALNLLPPGITLSFSPYAGDVQRWAANARSRGHEILVAIPMEPYDYPESDPGQYALKATGGEDANLQRMRWAMTRITGYTGVANLFGERFLTDKAALSPVLCFLAKRGLLFFDTGGNQNSQSLAAGEACKTAVVRASLRIDAVPAEQDIDRALSALEAQAKAKGVAVGSADLSPLVIERINTWAQTLAAKGIVLAPVSAVASPPK